MSNTNQFTEKLAAFYDSTHGYGEIGDESFYLDAATDADGPVLEGACRTGRLYLELLRRGVDADGFDVSPATLKVLRENATADGLTPTVWAADLRSIGVDRSYELVLGPYNSFCNLQGVHDQIAAPEALYTVLEPGGRLLFDVYVPRHEVIAEPFDEWHGTGEFEHEGETLSGRSRATIADQVEQHYRTEPELLDAEGEVVAREESVLSHLPSQQIELLARQSPFEQWSVRGRFDGEPLTDGDGIQVWKLAK